MLQCVVHYVIEGAKYSTLKKLSDTNKTRLLKAKEIRETYHDQNAHYEQCSSLPSIFDDQQHGIHLEPCYKRFTGIISRHESKLNAANSSSRKRKRTAPNYYIPEECIVFSVNCCFCKKNRVQHDKKDSFPDIIKKEETAKTIKDAAKRNEDKLFYNEIKDIDMVKMQYKIHRHCYNILFRKGKKEAGDENAVGDFEKVQTFVQDEVIGKLNAVSMSTLHELYGIGKGQSRYRSLLKAKLIAKFPNKLHFIAVDKVSPEVMISLEGLQKNTILNDKTEIIKQASVILRNDILEYAKNLPELSWPPNVDELRSNARAPPTSLTSFLELLIQPPGNPESDFVNRLVYSYSSDLIHAVTKGTIITEKQFLLGVGLHNMTGLKKPVVICSNLGHCINYDLVREIETAQAEVAQKLSNDGMTLKLQPKSDQEFVLTHFWVDNFNLKVDSMKSNSAINSTHMVAFQERSPAAVESNRHISIPRSKRRSLNPTAISNHEKEYVNPKQEPGLSFASKVGSYDPSNLMHQYNKWLMYRYVNSQDQSVPVFITWKAQVCNTMNSSASIEETEMTYLPPINADVAEFSTIKRYMTFLQNLSDEVNMHYTIITLDVGAAMNAFKFIWNHPETYCRVFLQLGDFHFLKENFTILGSIVTGSGFEDAIFQSGVCSSGSLNGVIAGSHYNRGWIIHRQFMEALERLLLERFVNVSDPIPDDVKTDSELPFQTGRESSMSTEYYNRYEDFKKDVRSGSCGKTPQFWLSYVDVMEIQYLALVSIHENNFDLRLFCWRYFLPLYFAFNKQNYARYGLYFVKLMENIDQHYPGLKELMEEKGFSVQGQTRYLLRTPVDQRGEQTINRDAKVAGGVKSFASNEAAVLKWTLTRSEQAAVMARLNQVAGIKGPSDVMKNLRPSQILASEKSVSKLLNVLSNEYINPFDSSLDADNLVNLSSGVPTDPEIAKDLLNFMEVGKEKQREFEMQRLDSNNVLYHAPITRSKLKTWKSAEAKKEISNDGRKAVIEVNRNILGKLLALSAKTERLIDFEKALQYPLSPVPLSLSHPNGTKRSTCKSKLQKFIIKAAKSPLKKPADIRLHAGEIGTYIIDFMAMIRTVQSIPPTFEEFILSFIDLLPKNYQRYDIVADSYLPTSIKQAERLKRGSSSKILVKSVKSKIPANFVDFLKNSDNKKRLIELFLDYFMSKKEKILGILHCECLFFSTYQKCFRITRENVIECNELSSNHEEADTKVSLHCAHALSSSTKKVLIRSPSADIDILVILLSTQEFLSRIYIDFNTGKDRQITSLDNFSFDEKQRQVILGLHAFTGNDYNSSFFRKGKDSCWKVLTKYDKFSEAFLSLGKELKVSDDLIPQLEEYVCCLYGQTKLSNVNLARHALFEKKYKKESKITDISLLPPCKSVLQLHTRRANLVAYTWRLSTQVNIFIDNYENHGWYEDLSIRWCDEHFPLDCELLLIEEDSNDDVEDYGIDQISDDELDQS